MDKILMIGGRRAAIEDAFNLLKKKRVWALWKRNAG
jgi:hypothetical protein